MRLFLSPLMVLPVFLLGPQDSFAGTNTVAVEKSMDYVRSLESMLETRTQGADAFESHILRLEVENQDDPKKADQNTAKLAASEDALAAKYEKTINQKKATRAERIDALRRISEIHFRRGRPLEATRHAYQLLAEYPQDKNILEINAEAAHLLALESLKKNDVERALAEYQGILSKPLDENWHAFAKDQIAFLLLRQGKEEDAVRWYKRIIQDHPDQRKWVAGAYYALARYYERKKDMRLSAMYDQQIKSKYAETPWAAAAVRNDQVAKKGNL